MITLQVRLVSLQMRQMSVRALFHTSSAANSLHSPQLRGDIFAVGFATCGGPVRGNRGSPADASLAAAVELSAAAHEIQGKRQAAEADTLVRSRRCSRGSAPRASKQRVHCHAIVHALAAPAGDGR